MAEDEEPERTRLEDIKYYTSLFLGTLAICSLFAFLFLVPFILDPAISTMMHEFVEKPVHCKVRKLFIEKVSIVGTYQETVSKKEHLSRIKI